MTGVKKAHPGIQTADVRSGLLTRKSRQGGLTGRVERGGSWSELSPLGSRALTLLGCLPAATDFGESVPCAVPQFP